MQAFMMNEDRELQLSQAPEPREREDNLIVRVRAASICGTDMRTFLKGNAKICAPRVLGHEFAGDVVYASPLAREKGFSEGCRVTAAPAIGCGECWPCRTGHTNMCDHLKTLGFDYDGVFAPYVEIPRQALVMGNVLPLPEQISYDDATLAEPAACALNGQSYLHIGPGDDVVIYGGGMIGCIHAELAFMQGASQVILVEPVEKRAAIAMEKVPGIVWINPFTRNTAEEVAALTDGKGANVVITATSVPSVHAEAQQIAAKMGRISLFGGLPGQSVGYLDSNLIHYKELSVCGVHATTAGYMRQILSYMLEGKLDAKKYIEKILPLDQILEGFRSIRDENTMKVVIHP
ncbi:MAG: alcohol dehydrogenase catalytic domain-containing protein [Oscillospiraceae bacterium]|nr:alcohol dehydrogenase catalytic domain-containing protein [Oscillospiraceae bacterium]